MISEADIDDVSKIIDWAGTNLGSDTQRVGMTGISQGSVLSLMAAANDHRVRAVAAMSTSFRTETPLIVNNTWFSQFMTLVKGAQVVNPLGPDLVAIVRGNTTPATVQSSPRRSTHALHRRNSTRSTATILRS
ncbi:hypothetical protein GCM10020255_086350 [Rhodococcus baikonurensis]